MLKGIYLGAYKALHSNYNIVYQDINGLRDLDGDMMDVDISEYDYIIATPPCNFWSRANHKPSEYSFKTKHLLIDIIDKLQYCGKPYIIENVRNDSKFSKYGLLNRHNIFVYRVGRHTYWSNILFDTRVNQLEENITNIKSSDRQGGYNVYIIIEKWLKTIHNKGYIQI